MIYLQLVYEYFKTGLFTFGGGLAAIPFLIQISERTGWFTTAQLTEMIAVSEATPGPIGVNMATYSGYLTAGVTGSVAATFGMITPSVIVTLITAGLLDKFRENALVESAFSFLRPASLGLISAAGLTVLRLSLLRVELWESSGITPNLFDIKAIALAAAIILLTTKLKPHPLFFIAGSAVAGILLKL